MKKFPRVPANARVMGLPIGGTCILMMMPRVFAEWPYWIWPSLWTLFAIYVVICLVDIAMRKEISDAKWQRVFGSSDD